MRTRNSQCIPQTDDIASDVRDSQLCLISIAGAPMAAQVRAEHTKPVTKIQHLGPPYCQVKGLSVCQCKYRRVVRPLDLVICREAVHINHRHALLFPFQGLR